MQAETLNLFQKVKVFSSGSLSKEVIAVCNFQFMKSPVELNRPFLKILLLYHLVCYINWLDATLYDLQTRPLCQILLFTRSNSLAVLKLQTDTICVNFFFMSYTKFQFRCILSVLQKEIQLFSILSLKYEYSVTWNG